MTGKDEEKVLTRDQEEMLFFLRDSKEKFPLDLRTAFDLGNAKHRTTLYHQYLELIHWGYIKERYITGRKGRHWITVEGKMALTAIDSGRKR